MGLSSSLVETSHRVLGENRGSPVKQTGSLWSTPPTSGLVYQFILQNDGLSNSLKAQKEFLKLIFCWIEVM